ncbi:MAG: ATP-grasp domain-containing protein [Lachnospiraceae bacterium]|nr:ATP-grasp domain-containing protein [Lachnospiraceae bacterium]
MEQKFYPLLFGGDINVYSLARAFHEEYKIKSTVYGKYKSGPAARSSIIDYHACVDNEKLDTFLSIVRNFAEEHKDAKVLVIGCSDSYVQLISENKDNLPENCIAPYIDSKMLNNLVQKEYFYNLCDKYDIDHPDTFIYKKEMGHDFEIPFKAPFICKPSCSITYWEHPFEGNDKVFIVNSREELLDILDRCYAAGYPDSMIIQDMIPGDDTYMRVLTSYSDKNGKVKMMCLGHTLLEEHTPHGSGNHATILTEYNKELCLKVKAFLEDIGYVGYSNFDIKYDERDNKFKFFEINCRQGRSNYYVTGAGFNVARYFVEDYIFNKDMDFTICKNESLWSVVPLKVAKDYIVSKYHDKMNQLVKEHKFSNSLCYSKDHSLLQKIWVKHNLARHKKNYATYYEKKN